jgi:hypothetical protein
MRRARLPRPQVRGEFRLASRLRVEALRLWLPLLALACAGAPPRGGAPVATSESAGPELSTSSQACAARTDGLSLRLDAPGTVPPGGSVVLRLVVTNVGDRTLRLSLWGPQEQNANFVVTTPTGSEAWSRMAAHRVPLASERQLLLAPGQERAFSVEWDGRGIQPGSGGRPVPLNGLYYVKGMLLLGPSTAPLETPPQPIRLAGRSPS